MLAGMSSQGKRQLEGLHRIHNRWLTAYIRELRKPNASRERLQYCVDRMHHTERMTAELERQLRLRKPTLIEALKSRYEKSHPERGSSTLRAFVEDLARQFPSLKHLQEKFDA